MRFEGHVGRSLGDGASPKQCDLKWWIRFSNLRLRAWSLTLCRLMIFRAWLPLLLSSFTAWWCGGAAEPTVSSNDLPRIPAVSPRDALGTFQVKKGFQLELAASEPNVVSPVAMAFDEDGRLFVVEMIDYSERREETPHLGRIRLLEDRDGDGVFERSTVYADNLPWPTAVFCYGGGILVGATPDILFLKDTNGD